MISCIFIYDMIIHVDNECVIQTLSEGKTHTYIKPVIVLYGKDYCVNLSWVTLSMYHQDLANTTPSIDAILGCCPNKR